MPLVRALMCGLIMLLVSMIMACTPADTSSMDTRDAAPDMAQDVSHAPADAPDDADMPGEQDDAGMPPADMLAPVDMSNPVDMSTPVVRPNILLIISDDQGIESSAQYNVGTDLPETPVLDELAAQGVVFEQAWATPACTTTRGTLITGQHGIHSGVDTVPDLLDPDIPTLHDHLTDQAPNYASAIIGKWHLGGRESALDGPANSGVPHYAGTIEGVIEDYWSWTLTSEGTQSTQTTYHTTAMTDLAIDWLEEQESLDKPWFLWLAYVAPHVPLHAPPATLHTRDLVDTPQDIRSNPRAYYLAAIEAMDSEIGRMLDTLSPRTRARTLIIFVGDNGTPAQAFDASVFDRSHVKNSLYEGGVRVPLVVSGAGVTRRGEREDALVHTVDFFPTVSDLLQLSPPAQQLDGRSFAALLDDASAATPRAFNYTAFVSNAVSGWTVRDAAYKLITFDDGRRELYHIATDLAEQRDLISDPSLAARIEMLNAYGMSQRAR